ncbi:MAG: hypothetical protein H6730_36195 [Deltaproteobacteria bacterium]|nr:hypothetical protein [Deltaproteobacteria bacterium]
MNPRTLLLAALVTPLVGCGGLSPAARAIVVANKPSVTQCRFLQVVYGFGGKSRNQALEAAAARRATHIVVLYEKGGKTTADAFDCAQPGVAVAAAKATGAAPVAPAPVAEAPAEPPVDATPVARDMTLAEPAPAWVIAVMDVQPPASADNPLDPGLMRNIGDQLRIFMAEQGVRTIDRGAQERTLRSQVEAMKEESYKQCYDDACQIELGKALAASHILRAQITRFGSLCVLNGELVDLRAEVATAAASSRGSCEEEGFLQMSEEVATILVKKSRG